MNEWISVKDRLPDKEMWILTFSFGSTNISHFYNGKISGCYDHDITANVTHWMPLPDPPQH